MSNIQGPPALFPFATPSETQHDSRLESAQQMPLVEEPQQAVPPIDSYMIAWAFRRQHLPL
jgi:hypothetical protein